MPDDEPLRSLVILLDRARFDAATPSEALARQILQLTTPPRRAAARRKTEETPE